MLLQRSRSFQPMPGAWRATRTSEDRPTAQTDSSSMSHQHVFRDGNPVLPYTAFEFSLGDPKGHPALIGPSSLALRPHLSFPVLSVLSWLLEGGWPVPNAMTAPVQESPRCSQHRAEGFLSPPHLIDSYKNSHLCFPPTSPLTRGPSSVPCFLFPGLFRAPHKHHRAPFALTPTFSI